MRFVWHEQRSYNGNLIFDELRAIQSEFGYLPAEQIEALSRRSNIPVSHIHGVVDFFPHFHVSPPARVCANVCMDMTCHLRGAEDLRASLQQRFGGMSPRDVAVGQVSCLGQCDGAPAMVVNDLIFREVSMAQAEGLILAALGGSELPHFHDEAGTAVVSPEMDRSPEPYSVVRKLLETRDWDGVLTQLKAAGLPGLGGAGFPTGLKWEAVRKAPGDEKYVICNADESEPGTIKDRFILERFPHLVAEGMIIAGLVTGARKGILYIRHEYHAQEQIFREEIERVKRLGLLGAQANGSDLVFDLEVFVSPGGYICGEETALIEAIEGKRAEPRNKPPFPVLEGLYRKPTALNNVETFANVSQILGRGVEWYKSVGRNGFAGLKFVGVSGDVNTPGVFQVPMGTPISEILHLYAGGVLGGKRLKAFAPSGPSSGYLPALMVDVPLSFKSLAEAGSMMGSGAIIMYAEGRCMLDNALNAVKFFRNESCGKCVPCRIGSQKMVDLLTGWTQGKGTPQDLDLLQELSEAMKLASICGLGQFAHSPITSVIKHFPEELAIHIREHRCPDGVCGMKEVRA